MSQQFDKQKTKQVRIDRDFHKELRIEAAENYSTIKSVLEERAGWISKERHLSKNPRKDEK